MRKFRLLKADEIECRIAQVKSNGISLLLYKTARTDANLLDETVGEFAWQNDFKLVDGVLYGGIGIKENLAVYDSPWIWKWDAGTESNTEAEKGRASDAFKRAGFKWGIGRELYTAPFIWIPSTMCEIRQDSYGNYKCYEKFEVVQIEYDNKEEISNLVIVNSKSRVEVFKMGEKATETFSGDNKISALQLKSLTKSCKEDGIEESYICELYSVKALADMTEAQMSNLVNNWDKMKAKYNERKNS